MAIKTLHNTSDRIWFITFTCHNWLRLFQITDSYDLVYKWLNFLIEKDQADTLGFVIMPNHVHILLYLKTEQSTLNTIIGNAKRFMAYDLIDRLKANQQNDILNVLTSSCSEKERAKGQLHKAFEPSFDAKPIYTEHFLHQKLDYIHYNPVRGKWNLCSDFINYPHSSAAFYELGIEHPQVSIKNFRLVW